MSRFKSAVISVILLGAGTLISLGLLEVLLRIYNPFNSRIKGGRIVLATNKQYHIRNNVIPSLEPVITFTRNSLGFRGPDPPADLSRYLSIVTIGGSTTQCFFLSDDLTWTARLAALLQPSVPKLWVNNAGLDGHSTYGHIVLLEDHISRIHPKVAIFLVGANDLARGPGVEFDAENVKSSISFQSPTAFVKSLSPYSEVAALAANLYRSLNAYQQGLLHQKVDLRQQGYFDPPPAVRSDYFAETANPSFLQGYEARLRRILAICKDNHITPILATQPLLGGPAIDDATGIDLARVRANPRANGEMWWESLEAYNDVTRRVGRESGVLVVDVAHEMPKSSRFFYDFVHFTAAGAQQVAGILYAHVCPALSADFPGYFAAGSCGAASSGR